MSDDIVHRLRLEGWCDEKHKEAAEEIERLRAEVERLTNLLIDFDIILGPPSCTA